MKAFTELTEKQQTLARNQAWTQLVLGAYEGSQTFPDAVQTKINEYRNKPGATIYTFIRDLYTDTNMGPKFDQRVTTKLSTIQFREPGDTEVVQIPGDTAV